jgi:hypothetical protein
VGSYQVPCQKVDDGCAPWGGDLNAEKFVGAAEGTTAPVVLFGLTRPARSRDTSARATQVAFLS